MTINEAREVLLLRGGATIDDARESYYALASALHPDHGGSADEFGTIADAWRVVREWFDTPQRCMACCGAGHVVAGSPMRPMRQRCSACGGRGKAQPTSIFVDEP